MENNVKKNIYVCVCMYIYTCLHVNVGFLGSALAHCRRHCLEHHAYVSTGLKFVLRFLMTFN